MINLGTPDPIKVDVNMRINLYQYKGDEATKPDAEQKTYEETIERQRNRMSEVQQLKDNRFVAEDHRALLHLRDKPAGEWGVYVEKTVKDENEDRMIMMRHQAKDGNITLHDVQEEQWKLRIGKAFKGEWIEMPGDKPNAYLWQQSSGPKSKEVLKEIKTSDAPPKPATEAGKPPELAPAPDPAKPATGAKAPS